MPKTLERFWQVGQIFAIGNRLSGSNSRVVCKSLQRGIKPFSAWTRFWRRHINKEFLSKGLFAYWEDRSEKNAQVLLDWLLTIEGTKWHYLHGVRDPTAVGCGRLLTPGLVQHFNSSCLSNPRHARPCNSGTRQTATFAECHLTAARCGPSLQAVG